MSLHFKNNNPSSHNILVVHLKVVLKWKDTYIENMRRFLKWRFWNCRDHCIYQKEHCTRLAFHIAYRTLVVLYNPKRYMAIGLKSGWLVWRKCRAINMYIGKYVMKTPVIYIFFLTFHIFSENFWFSSWLGPLGSVFTILSRRYWVYGWEDRSRPQVIGYLHQV